MLVEGLRRDRRGLQADLGHRDRRDHQGQNVHPLRGRVSGSLRKRTHGSGLKLSFLIQFRLTKTDICSFLL